MASITLKNGDPHQLKKDIAVYYKTADIDRPLVLAQKSEKYPGKVAVAVNLMPTFSVDPQNLTGAQIEVESDEEPEEDLVKPADERSLFVFLVDRSGSMGFEKMETTKEALKLFV